MLANFANQVEIKFWDLWIQSISQSPWLRQTVQNLYRVSHDRDSLKMGIWVVASASFGLMLGFFLHTVQFLLQ
jgi:hypothetical protein